MLRRRGSFQEAIDELAGEIDKLIDVLRSHKEYILILDKDVLELKKKVSELESKIGKNNSDWLIEQHRKIVEDLRRRV